MGGVAGLGLVFKQQDSSRRYTTSHKTGTPRSAEERQKSRFVFQHPEVPKFGQKTRRMGMSVGFKGAFAWNRLALRTGLVVEGQRYCRMQLHQFSLYQHTILSRGQRRHHRSCRAVFNQPDMYAKALRSTFALLLAAFVCLAAASTDADLVELDDSTALSNDLSVAAHDAALEGEISTPKGCTKCSKEGEIRALNKRKFAKNR